VSLHIDIVVNLLTGNRLGLTKTGQGARVEAIARGIPVLIVPGKFLAELLILIPISKDMF